MSYRTVEVEIDHGHVHAKGSETLPEKASGLLTLFPTSTTERAATALSALESLQKHLQLDAAKAADWMNSVQSARR